MGFKFNRSRDTWEEKIFYSKVFGDPEDFEVRVSAEEKLLHCISVFDYTTQCFRAPNAKQRPGPAITKFFFIVYHPEINNKTDFILRSVIMSISLL